MRPDIGPRGQLLKSEEELKRNRSIGAKKRKKLWCVSSPHMSASLLPYDPAWYTESGPSGAGSSRPRPSSSSSDSSGYRDYATSGESDSSDESDGGTVIPRDFINFHKAEHRVLARLRGLVHLHLHVDAKEEKELADTLSLIERQEAEKREVECLRRQETKKAEVINLD